MTTTINNIIDLSDARESRNLKRKIKRIQDDIEELKTIQGILKNSMNDLTKYNKYFNIKIHIGATLELYRDLKHFITQREEMIKALEIKDYYDV
jgi:flagellar biosynthesis chaperone FliJ